ncbi:hypothetical protein CB1_001915001 [Camelus ferus]|nr:hypothetical protein CB1_001915001 [Camelus ferus]
MCPLAPCTAPSLHSTGDSGKGAEGLPCAPSPDPPPVIPGMFTAPTFHLTDEYIGAEFSPGCECLIRAPAVLLCLAGSLHYKVCP